MRKKKQHHEEHMDETWLIPYADMLTLLLALFIVMFAMSQVDKQKMSKLSEQFNVIFSGGSSILDQQGSSIVPEESPSSSKSSNAIEDTQMNNIKNTLQQEIENKGYGDKVKVDLNGEGLEISIQDTVLFNSGDATVLSNISPLLIEISGMIKNLDNNIKVVGHTDNVPISSGKFRSNWDLSATRAINVMNFMVSSGGLSPNKLSIQAYGEYMPKFDNSTAEGRAKNRRVEIFVIRNYPLSSDTTESLSSTSTTKTTN